MDKTCNQRKTDKKYLASEATCESAAKYYYSCTCGEYGSKKFSYGDPLEHDFDRNGVCAECGYEKHECSFNENWNYNDTHHWHECINCDEIADKAVHFDKDRNSVCDACGYEYPEEDALLWGDVNGDGLVDTKDSTRLSQYFAGHSVKIIEDNADVNGDGSVTRADAMILARYVAKWSGYKTLPYRDGLADMP